jgi:tripartite-type tricarboxylate transporter receptor subunit TctC
MLRHACASLLMSVLLTGAVAAQGYPSKPIRFIVPNTPGTVSDLAGRIVVPEMSKALGQPIVVENKAGAGQVIGLEYVAKQMPPDGYNIAVVSVSTMAIMPMTVKELRFDPLRDLPPVIGLIEGRYLLGSSSTQPWKTFAEMIDHARANPGKLNYGSPSTGVRLPTEAMLRALKLNVVHVPYNGGGPYLNALVAGEVQMGLVAESQAAAFGERFRVLAVTGSQRLAALRDVPTFVELGLPQITGLSFSLNVAAGTPGAVINVLHAAAARALQQADVKAQFAKIQMEVTGHSPEAAARNLASEARMFADIARDLGLQPQ